MNKINMLREWLVNNKLRAFIVPSSDAHQSEYVADYWASRRWLTGFTGSAGTAVVTDGRAAMWTDSRYFLQAAMQLEGSGFELQKAGLPETPSMEKWLIDNTSKGDRIGIDGRLFTKNQFDEMSKALCDRVLVAVSDPFAEIWADRPMMPTTKAILLPEEYSGESTISKIKRIRPSEGTLLIGILDDIAWLLNIRGSDIDCNPLVISYAAVEQERVLLFVDETKFSDTDYEKLAACGVELRKYEEWDSYLQNLNGVVIANSSRLDVNSWNLLKNITPESVPQGVVAMAKAVKNDVEINGFRRAMVDDGVALCRFMMWLEKADNVTEYEAATKLSQFRAGSKAYRGDSFGAIIGYGSNGAIVHYSPSKESSSEIKRDNFLLIDSGGQYLYGTTDITRTFFMGDEPSEAQKRDYTNVLMGVIDISRAVFPANTRGVQLDVLARQHMWRDGVNYLHGTGHGVGHFLCVHEGPQSIRMNENPVTLCVGMVQSVEPAIYRTGEYGIRTENLVAVIPAKKEGFMEFETLTLSPIDLKAVDRSLMSREHLDWLNSYHAMVYDKLSPALDPHEQEWLKSKTVRL